MYKQVFKLYTYFPAIIFLTVMVIPVMYGCSKGTTDIEEIVATVNKEPLKLEDFQSEIALRSSRTLLIK